MMVQLGRYARQSFRELETYTVLELNDWLEVVDEVLQAESPDPLSSEDR